MRCASPLALCLGCLFAPAYSSAESVVLPAARDNSLYENPTGAVSNGSGELLISGRNNQPANFRRRALLMFDVAGGLPAGSVVTDVILSMECTGTNSTSTFLDLHRLVADWGEGLSDAGIPGGSGAPAESNDATWLHRQFDGVFWSSAGGDFEPAILATASVTGPGPVEWSSTSAMVATVQAWLDDPSGNFGIAMIGDETTPQSACNLASREHAVAEFRPTMTVTFLGPEEVPATSAWGCLILCLLLATAASVRLSEASRAAG